jgi:hypothetical protein
METQTVQILIVMVIFDQVELSVNQPKHYVQITKTMMEMEILTVMIPVVVPMIYVYQYVVMEYGIKIPKNVMMGI